MSNEATARLSCANCGETVSLEFCPRCGQDSANLMAPVQELAKDVLEEFFKFDSRLLSTLRLLLLSPGALSAEYLSGRRVRYVAPFKLYFTVTAIFFLAFALAGGFKQLAAKPGDRPWVEHFSLVVALLVPLVALLLWRLLKKRRGLYIEHLIFVVHFQTFFFMIALVALPLGDSLWGNIVMLGLPSAYLVPALRRFYRVGWGRALALMAALFVGYHAMILVVAVGFGIAAGVAKAFR
jgi:hypothetical protein